MTAGIDARRATVLTVIKQIVSRTVVQKGAACSCARGNSNHLTTVIDAIPAARAIADPAEVVHCAVVQERVIAGLVSGR